ncbi:extensin-like [Quercus robur]|uniref:extensin-like n=1 Tax=Quercus robur TaxID=38942 RepID=UPI0021630F24|nr:extensin-like [Quercus robur]
MLLLAAVALLLTSLPSYEARKILQIPMKRNQDQVPPTFVPVPNPLSQKALAGDQINVSSLLGGLDWAPRVPVPPSAPSPGTYIPSSAMRQRKNPPHPSMLHNAYHVSPPNPFSQKASAGDQINVSSLLGGLDWAPHVPVPPSAPSPGTYIPSSAMTQTKNPPHPSMLHEAYHVSPPNPSTPIIPPSTTTSHNPAPLLGTPQMSPLPPSVNTAPSPQKSPLPPFVSNRADGYMCFETVCAISTITVSVKEIP